MSTLFTGISELRTVSEAGTLADAALASPVSSKVRRDARAFCICGKA